MKKSYIQILMIFICAFYLPAAVPGSGQGSISGVVTNKATGDLLRDATVEILEAGRVLLTDELGRFLVRDLPFGTYQITVSYLALDSDTQTVTLSQESSSASLEFPLGSEVYQLQTFVVSGEREGTAAALTRQKTSDNIKSVVSMDAMGQLASENPGELLSQMAGIAGDVDDSGEVTTISIRGISSALSSVTYDGAQVATSFGLTNRSFRFLNINAATFEELEVIKALTPNVSAASLGGTVNMKTKSTLNMKERIRVDYRAATLLRPAWLDYNPRRSDRLFSPVLSLDYRQVFDLGKGKRNLGVYLNLFYKKNESGAVSTQLDYASTFTEEDSYIYKHVAKDSVSTKTDSSATLRFDYKLSERSRFYLSTMYSQRETWSNEGREGITTTYNVANKSYIDRSKSNSTYTEASRGAWDITQGVIGFFDGQYRAQIGGEHLLQHLALNYDFAFSRSKVELDGNKSDIIAGKTLIARISAVGGIIDRRHNNDFPVFSPLPGNPANKDIYNIENYRGNTVLRHRKGTRTNTVYDGKLDAKSDITLFNLLAQVSSGLAFRSQKFEELADSYEYKFEGSSLSQFLMDIALDPRLGEAITEIPCMNMDSVARDLLENPVNWTENKTYHFQEDRNGTRALKEDVYAVYLMGKTRIKNLGILAGARVEHTKASGTAWELRKDYSSIPSIYDRYDNVNVRKNYTDLFPSIHLSYSFGKNFLARASWSTAIGRPEPRQLVPGLRINESTKIITQNNPDLKPQYAHNFDLSLEYYLPSASMISAGAFRKEISDFIYTSTGQPLSEIPESGFGPEYDDYTLNKQYNGKKAHVNGVELSYNQLLKFLPAPLDNMRLIISYTLLGTKGDYAENGGSLSTSDVEGFVPRIFNARLTYNYKRFGFSVATSHQADYITTYSSDPTRSIYREARWVTSANVSWRFSRYLTLGISVNNIFDEPLVYYRGKADRREKTSFSGQLINIGISGRF